MQIQMPNLIIAYDVNPYTDGLSSEKTTVTTDSEAVPATEILEEAYGCLYQRGIHYDKPEGERSMRATVEAFKAVTGVTLSEVQGWLFMALLKAVRSQQGAFKLDSYIDGAAYFALAGEAGSYAQTTA